MSWEFSRRVLYYETDRMGVVHHSNYLRLLEDARMEWFGAHLMRYSDMEKMGIIIPTVEATGHFKAFLVFDDPFTVSMKMIRFNGIRISFSYEIRQSETGVLCYDGETTHCFTSGTDGVYKPLSMKKSYPDLYERLLAQLDQDE